MRCFKIPDMQVDGMACEKCCNYSFCICKCASFQLDNVNINGKCFNNQFDEDLFLSLKNKKRVLSISRDDRFPLNYDRAEIHNKLMSSNFARLESFGSKIQGVFSDKVKNFDVREFVRAGFYYSGKEDKVVCHYCGLGICKFEWNDNIYQEHIRFKPDCQYLINQVGISLIARYCKNVDGMCDMTDAIECMNFSPKCRNMSPYTFYCKYEKKIVTIDPIKDYPITMSQSLTMSRRLRIRNILEHRFVNFTRFNLEDNCVDSDYICQNKSEAKKQQRIDNKLKNFDYNAYHPSNRKNLIAKNLYSEYCIYFYQGDFGNCIDIINRSRRHLHESAKICKINKTKMRRQKRDFICQMFSFPKNVINITNEIVENEFVSQVQSTIDEVSLASKSAQQTLKRTNSVLKEVEDNDLVNKATSLAKNIELLCSKTTSAVDKANAVFDQVLKTLTPTAPLFRKTTIIAAATKLFASCKFSLMNLFAYFACICATFGLPATAFSTIYAYFKSHARNFVSMICQSSDNGDFNEEEESDKFSLFASISHTLAVILGVPISLKEIGKKMGDLGRTITGGEKIYKVLNKIFSWVRDKYFHYKYDISYDQYTMQVKFPELSKLAECCLLIGQVENDEIDSTRELCDVILETDKLAHDMSMCTLKESDASRYIATLRASIKSQVNRALKSPVMAVSARRRPFAIYLYGKAGTGKTNLTDIIRAAIFKRYYAKTYAPGWTYSSFSRKTENEYWEGYHGQPIVVYDDVFQIHDSREKPNPEIMELIRVINDDDYQLHMATLEDKAGTYFKSDFVICTSNIRIPACNSIACPSAVYRRMNVSVDVEVNPKFGKTMVDKTGGSNYLGIDDTKVSDIIDTNVYKLSAYNMNTPNGDIIAKFDNNDESNSFDKFMEHLFIAIDKHRNTCSDRSERLKMMAGEKVVTEIDSGLRKAQQIFSIQNTLPSNNSGVKSMHGKAPFKMSALKVDEFEPDKLDISPFIAQNDQVKYNVKSETIEMYSDIPLNDSWRERLPKVRRKIGVLYKSLCNKAVECKDKINVFHFPTHTVSEKLQYVTIKLKELNEKLSAHVNLHEMIDTFFDNISSILLGTLSVIGVVLAGKKTSSYIRSKNVVCPLTQCIRIEDILNVSNCTCECCNMLRPFVSRVDGFDDKRKTALSLFGVLKMALKEDDKLSHLQHLVNAENVLSHFRENDKRRQRKMAKAYGVHPDLIDSRQTVCEIASGDNVTKKKSSHMTVEIENADIVNSKIKEIENRLVSEINSGDSLTRKKSQPMTVEIDSGDSITSKKSRPMVVEISSGDSVTSKKSGKMLTENLDEQVNKLESKVNDDLLISTEVDKTNESFLKRFFVGAGNGNLVSDSNVGLMTCEGKVVNKDQCFREQYNKCVSRNSVRVSCVIDKGDVALESSVNGVFLQGRILMIPHHMYLAICKSKDKLFSITNPFRSVSSQFSLDECVSSQLVDMSGDKLDCMFVAMPLRVPSYPSLLNLFSKASEMSKIVEGDMILAGLRSFGPGMLMLVNHHISDGSLRTQVKHMMADKSVTYNTASAIEYSAATQAGDCGCLLFSRNSSMRGRITGMHIAGNKSHGMSLALTNEMLVRNLKLFSQIVLDDRKFVKGSFSCQSSSDTIHVNPILSRTGLDVEGDYLSVGVGKLLPRPVKTNLNESLIHNEIYPTQTKPAFLRETMIDGKKIDPLKKGICKAFTVQPRLNNKILKIAAHDVRNQFKYTRNDIRRVLTYEEALKGVDGCEYACGINRTTSAGFPWVFNVKTCGKRDWLGTTEEWDVDNSELRECVDNVIAKAKNNERSDVVFISTLKDERRPIEKVNSGKTRVFEAGPMHYTVCIRKYFLGFVESVMRNRIDNEVCVGVNVYSNDWNRLGCALSKYGNKVIAGDFSNFDGSLHQEILWEICKIINSWYDDGEENARVRNVLFEEIVNSVVLVDGILIQKTHSQPSGNPLTVIINSLFNQIVMRMAYLLAKEEQDLPLLCDFTDHVSMATYGDDNALNIAEDVIEWYNQVSITKHLKTFGLTYTDEAKTGICVPFRSLSDINFLKRKFVKNESGVFVAPLLIETVRDMCNWVRGKEIRSATIENVGNALLEFALHGPGTYDYESNLIDKALKAKRLHLRIPLYEEFESFFLTQRKQM
jgi:hypothetical protein